jgi:hypothetical protein
VKTRFTTAIGLMFAMTAGAIVATSAQDKPMDSTQAAVAQPAAPAPEAAPKKAPEAKSQGNFYGKIYADWDYDVTKNPPGANPNYYQKSLFELTRVYMGYNCKINDNFTTDALLDIARVDPLVNTISSPAADTLKVAAVPAALAVKINDSYIAYLKTAYLAWKNIFPTGTLSVGQIPYFAFDVMESFWAHRYIYKTFMDQQGWESSADLGAKLMVNPIDMLKITGAITNGEGYKSNQDAYGDYKLAIAGQVNPVKELTLYLYGDWMPEKKNTKDSAQQTISAFAGYKILDLAKVGLEYDNQFRVAGIVHHNLHGLSAYGMYNIIKELEALLRYDYAWSENKYSTADGQTVIAGLQYAPVSKVKLALDYQRVIPRIQGGAVGYNKIFVNGEFDY